MTDNLTIRTLATEELLWPRYAQPSDLAEIESVPLARRGLVQRPTAAAEPQPLEPLDGVRVGYLDELAAAHDPAAFAGEPPLASDLAALFHTGGTTETDLLGRATRHVPERAAAPGTVTILDALPVIDVGKPYKLGLRADVTRRDLLDALTDITGVHSIAGTVEDGATVELGDIGDETAVAAILARYPIEWRIAVRR